MAKLPNIIEKDRSTWSVIWFVFMESLRGSRKHSTIRYVLAVFDAATTFAQFGAIAIIVNEFVVYGVAGAHTIVLIKGLVLLVVADFVPAIISGIASYSTDTQNNNISRHLQSLFFDKMNSLDIGTIEQPELQNIMEITTTRSWSFFYTTIWHITTSIKQVVSLIIASIALLGISPIVFIIIFTAAIPSYFIERRNGVILNQLYKESSESSRAWKTKTSVMYDKNSLIEARNFGILNIFKKKFLSLIIEFHNKQRDILKSYRKIDLMGKVILVAAFTTSIIILIHNVSIGTIAVGSLVFSVSVVTKFQTAAEQIFDTMGKLSEYKKSIGVMMDFLEMEPLVTSGTRPIELDDFKSLEIKNISFTYPGSKSPVIHNMSLKINHTDSLAIVGLNGAGKTTLIKLLTRVYDPTKGKILVNGIDLKEYDLKSWKRCLGILLQDYTMYSEETIAENIMLGDTSKHDQEFVESVAKETTADVFIQELPEKYEQKIGTEFRGGVELSKGQKQKLALTRVLYRNSPVIILDEPTAAIDALSEDIIFKNLKNKHTHQTRVIISHKFSNVRDADKIILIEHGKIIEQGNHDELMAIEGGKYRELFNLQAEGYQDKSKRKPRNKKVAQVSNEVTEVAQ